MKTIEMLLFAALASLGNLLVIPLISNVTFPMTVGKYQKFELDFHLNQYANPYDCDEIDIWAEFISPTGKESKVYGFYFEGYRKLDDGHFTTNEILTRTGEDGWKIRFSPNEIGNWTVVLKAKNSTGITIDPAIRAYSFSATPTNEKGFISAANTRYPKYDSGDPYIPIGDSYPLWGPTT